MWNPLNWIVPTAMASGCNNGITNTAAKVANFIGDGISAGVDWLADVTPDWIKDVGGWVYENGIEPIADGVRYIAIAADDMVEGVFGERPIEYLYDTANDVWVHIDDCLTEAGFNENGKMTIMVGTGAGLAAGTARAVTVTRGATATSVIDDVTDAVKQQPNVRVVIGENMPDRVTPTAKQYDADVYVPKDAPESEWMENNRKWINEKMDTNCEIIDCGPDPKRPVRSEYYQMELDEINARSYNRYRRVNIDD